MVFELWCTVLSAALEHALCPSCPTAQAARDAFWSDGVVARIGGMIGPFIVTAGLVALVVRRLAAGEVRGGSTQEKSHESR